MLLISKETIIDEPTLLPIGQDVLVAATEQFVTFCKTLISIALPAEALMFRPLASLTSSDGLYSAPCSPAMGAIESVYLVDRQRIAENRFRPVVVRGNSQAHMALALGGVASID